MFTGDGDGDGVRLKESIKLNLWSYYYYHGDILYVVGPIAIILFLVIIVYTLISSFFKNKKLKIKNKISDDDANYQFSSKSSPFDVVFHQQQQHQEHNHNHDDENDNGDVLLEASHDDAKYAEQLQFQEAILASMLSSPSSSSSSSTRIPTSSSLPLSSFLFNNNHDNDVVEIQVCNICLENQENWKMFINSTCPHSFCYDCITKHATTKIQQKNTNITCPEFNCNSTLDSNILRLIIPRHIMIKWDEMLCESTILESHKLYCPFANCSALLINDDITITEIDCPVCKRSICAVCRVQWHSEFTCKEFGKLNSKKKGEKDEKMTEALAKKKKWKKCPKCKFFVEKSEGCLHITCRCKYEFCYNCGAKWTTKHGGCRRRS